MGLETADQLLLPRDPAADMEAATKQYVDASAPSPDFISGLILSKSADSVVGITAGRAYVQSAARVVTAAAGTASFISSVTSTFMHVYLGADGQFSLESPVTGPIGNPYFGAARSMAGDTSKRYIGSVLFSAAADMVPFTMLGTKMRYLANPSNAPFRVLSGGNATTSATVDLSGVLPPTARIAHARLLEGANGQAYVGNSDMGATLPSNYMTTARPNSEFEADLLTDSSQAVTYMVNNSGSLTIDVQGYEFER